MSTTFNALDRLAGIPFEVTMQFSRDVYGPDDQEGCFVFDVEVKGKYVPAIAGTMIDPPEPDIVTISEATDHEGNEFTLLAEEEDAVLEHVRHEMFY